MKKHLLAFIGAALLLPVTAHAQYTGPYLGIEAGYSNTDVNLKFPDDTKVSFDDDGFGYGFFAGYRHNLNGVVVGAEARLGDADNKGSVTTGGETVTLSTKREIGIGGILGFTPDNRFMIFGIIGYQNLKGRGTVDGVSDTSKDGGVRYGGGLEYAFTPQVSVRATLTQTDYGNQFTEQEAADLGAQANVKQTKVNGGLIVSF